MIRLGSLACYSFEGPRVLGGWTPSAEPGVFAILYKPEPEKKPEKYAVIFVGHSDDLASEGFPFKHRRAHCWSTRAGSKWKVHIAYLEVPGDNRSHREMIARNCWRSTIRTATSRSTTRCGATSGSGSTPMPQHRS